MVRKIEELEKYKEKCEAEKKAYQYSRANLHALIENARNSIWSVDRAYQILTINSHFKREFSAAFGINLEEGMKITECVPLEMSKIWIRRYERAFKGENFSKSRIRLLCWELLEISQSVNMLKKP